MWWAAWLKFIPTRLCWINFGEFSVREILGHLLYLFQFQPHFVQVHYSHSIRTNTVKKIPKNIFYYFT